MFIVINTPSYILSVLIAVARSRFPGRITAPWPRAGRRDARPPHENRGGRFRTSEKIWHSCPPPAAVTAVTAVTPAPRTRAAAIDFGHVGHCPGKNYGIPVRRRRRPPPPLEPAAAAVVVVALVFVAVAELLLCLLRPPCQGGRRTDLMNSRSGSSRLSSLSA